MSHFSRKQKIKALMAMWVAGPLIVYSSVWSYNNERADFVSALLNNDYLIYHDTFYKQILFFAAPVVIIAIILCSLYIYYDELKGRRPIIFKKIETLMGVLMLACVALIFISGPFVNHADYVRLKSAGYERCERSMLDKLDRQDGILWTKDKSW